MLLAGVQPRQALLHALPLRSLEEHTRPLSICVDGRSTNGLDFGHGVTLRYLTEQDR